MSPPKDGNIYKLTSRMNESWTVNNISRITGAKMDISNSNFCDDSKMMELLQNENENIFEEIDMG